MTARKLYIGGIEIPLSASHTLGQSYAPVQAVNRPRMMDGTLLQQTSWSGKLRTVINGGGLMPAGLQTLDFTGSIIIKCIAERAISGTSNVFLVPAARRADYGVVGRALVSDVWQTTAVTMIGNQATLTVAAGATQYQAIYWPELVCFCDPPTETRGARNADYGWSLEGEEI